MKIIIEKDDASGFNLDIDDEAAKLAAYALVTRHGFKVYNEVIAAPGDGLITFTVMQDHNAESIKSLEGYGRTWVEEAQTLSARSLALLRPTISLDLGGTGAKADAFVIWVCRFGGREIRVLNYYEAVGQLLSAHLSRPRCCHGTHCVSETLIWIDMV
jgi:hypothetical protein